MKIAEIARLVNRPYMNVFTRIRRSEAWKAANEMPRLAKENRRALPRDERQHLATAAGFE